MDSQLSPAPSTTADTPIPDALATETVNIIWCARGVRETVGVGFPLEDFKLEFPTVTKFLNKDRLEVILYGTTYTGLRWALRWFKNAQAVRDKPPAFADYVKMWQAFMVLGHEDNEMNEVIVDSFCHSARPTADDLEEIWECRYLPYMEPLRSFLEQVVLPELKARLFAGIFIEKLRNPDKPYVDCGSRLCQVMNADDSDADKEDSCANKDAEEYGYYSVCEYPHF